MVLLLTSVAASIEICTAAPAFPLTVLLLSDTVTGQHAIWRAAIASNRTVGYLNCCCAVSAKCAEPAAAENSAAGIVVVHTAVGYVQRRNAAADCIVINPSPELSVTEEL